MMSRARRSRSRSARVAVVFMAFFMPASSLDTITQNVYEEMASITLLSIPLFILKGAAIGRSRAGQDLYAALHAWMQPRPRRPRHRQRVRLRPVRGDGRLEPGDLLGDRLGRHPGDAQARLLAGLCGRHHRRRRHARHPAAAVDHDDPVRGRRRAVARAAVPRRHRPGRCCWSALFAGYAVVRYRKEHRRAIAAYAQRRHRTRRCSTTSTSRCARSSRCCRASLPFVMLLIGVMVALYGGFATPSETAGLGALLALVLIAVVYGVWRSRTSRRSSSATLQGVDDADVHHRHVAAVLVRDELPAHQPVDGAVDRRAAAVEVAAAGGDPAAGRSCSASSCRRSASS